MPQASKNGSSQYKAGFGREIITPARGTPLAGYFTPRFASGNLDELYVKACLFSCADSIAGMVVFDLVSCNSFLIEKIQEKMKKAEIPFLDSLILCATHTHTGPVMGRVGDPPTPEIDAYLALIAEKAVYAVKQAQANLYPSEIYYGSVINNPFAFNRRFYMKDDKVVTNPGKLNPEIVRPESGVDKEIGILKVVQDGSIAGIITNITNHTDTTSGDQVSADWPGHLERYIHSQLGEAPVVISTIAPSGNINHFDVTSEDDQTSLAEARRIGTGYGEIVWKALPDLSRIEKTSVKSRRSKVTVGYRKVSDEELNAAKELMAQPFEEQGETRLTSEDLANENPVVMRMFAEALLKYVEWAKGPEREFDLVCLSLGDEFAITSLPSEPFTEIGMAIKAGSPAKLTMVASLAHGSCGYVGMKECFGRGGYETSLYMVGAGAGIDTAERFINNSIAMLNAKD